MSKKLMSQCLTTKKIIGNTKLLFGCSWYSGNQTIEVMKYWKRLMLERKRKVSQKQKCNRKCIGCFNYKIAI